MNITLDQAETLVVKRNDVSWDGWTLVRTRSNPSGWLRQNGTFNRDTGQWATTDRFEVQSDGTYNIPKVIGNGL